MRLHTFLYQLDYGKAAMAERYTANNRYLLQYLQHGIDPYDFQIDFGEWVLNDDELLEFYREHCTEPLETADEIHDLFNDLWEMTPEEYKKTFIEHIKDDVLPEMLQHAPYEVPTYGHMSLERNRLLDRQTWLIHFSDDADAIVSKGFLYGEEDMRSLALTNWKVNRKKDSGYVFAFDANSREVSNAASKKTYGDAAVLFQNSGVHTYHYGDDENQIVFWGPDVDPKTMVLLNRSREKGGWMVVGNFTWRNTKGRDAVFYGSLEDCITWVETNYRQYRKVITGH